MPQQAQAQQPQKPEGSGHEEELSSLQQVPLPESVASSIKMSNVVATTDLQCKPDLKQVYLQVRNAEYNPKKFPAVVMKIDEPKATALFFSTGKMVIVGTKSDEHAKLAAKKLVAIIRRLGIPATIDTIKVNNMTASCDLGFPIRLEGVVMVHAKACSYEPELFPGLIYRMFWPHRVVLLIFVSGKMVVTGAKSAKQIRDAVEAIYTFLMDFRKRPVAPPPSAIMASDAPPNQDAETSSSSKKRRVANLPTASNAREGKLMRRGASSLQSIAEDGGS